MAQAKPAGTWIYDDLFTLPDDARRYEIIEGELYAMPSPGSAHALTIMNLILALAPIISRLGGRLLTAPLDVFFPGANPVQPDIVVMLPASPARLVPRGVEGAPDLVIEVLSPSNRGHDLLTKRALYARAGVREYGIVDPEARTLDILTLDRDAFHLAATLSGNSSPVSPFSARSRLWRTISSPRQTPSGAGNHFRYASADAPTSGRVDNSGEEGCPGRKPRSPGGRSPIAARTRMP